MTPNAITMSSPQPHNGTSSVLVGNSQSLSITHKGDVCLSKSHNSRIILSDVLCVPSLHKNLLSIHKLTSDTNSICILDSSGFVIKAKRTGQTLFSSHNNNGL
ncbi:hypothetical protein Patl1_34730 [Pistacia atlantica]|uniref:Uncharacterized protein n=1 Tax=Pistacia atlantica TaxID=434234 RepID=A0ACC0ZSK3_9ROSI|nr:hypothetical protein Patl1_34730 [Pistacia atlantica]